MCESGQGAAADTIALPFLSVQPCCFLLGCPVAGLVWEEEVWGGIRFTGTAAEHIILLNAIYGQFVWRSSNQST